MQNVFNQNQKVLIVCQSLLIGTLCKNKNQLHAFYIHWHRIYSTISEERNGAEWRNIGLRQNETQQERLPILPKLFCHLETNHSNLWAYGEFSLKHRIYFVSFSKITFLVIVSQMIFVSFSSSCLVSFPNYFCSACINSVPLTRLRLVKMYPFLIVLQSGK